MANNIVCTPRTLSNAQRAKASAMARTLGLDKHGPAVISVVRATSWGNGGARLTTAFMDNPSKALRREILRHLNMWSKRCNVTFVESKVNPMVRIARLTGKDGGYWSWVGREILGIDSDEPTMNLEGFTMRTPLSEFRSVVCHEAGHTLGFPHEHMRRELVTRIDRQKAYAFFLESDGWSPQDVDEQVLTPLDKRTILGTPVDQTSIMCYQLPGSITIDGKPILGGDRINETDYAFAARIYPLPPSAKPKTKRSSSKKGVAKKQTATRRTTKRTRKAKRA